MTQTQDAPTEAEVITDDVEVVTTEVVAKTIATLGQIGEARRALERDGFNTSITGNRLMVDGLVEAQLIANNGRAWWNVYNLDGTPPVWVVGAQRGEGNWIGCVE